MASLHTLDAASGAIVSQRISDGAPLRIGAGAAAPHGNPTGNGNGKGNGDWQVAVVPFAARGVGAARTALVAREGSGVFVGSRPVDGVVELRDGDRIFLDDGELLFSVDELPLPLSQSAGETCELCCGALDGERRTAILACPRCGAPACDDCWQHSPTGRCATPACPQLSALDRELWQPCAADFTGVLGGAEDVA